MRPGCVRWTLCGGYSAQLCVEETEVESQVLPNDWIISKELNKPRHQIFYRGPTCEVLVRDPGDTGDHGREIALVGHQLAVACFHLAANKSNRTELNDTFETVVETSGFEIERDKPGEAETSEFRGAQG